MNEPVRRRDGKHTRMSERAMLSRTRGGVVLLTAWWVLLALAIAGAAALTPFVLHGEHAGGVAVTARSGVVAGSVGVALVALCFRIVGLRALLGIGGLVFGVGLMLFAVRPAVSAGAPPALAAWVAAVLMAFVTLGLTYGSNAVSVAGTVSMAASLTAAAAPAACVVPIVAPGQPLLVAVTVLSTFGGLCDVAITQVSTVVVAARRISDEPDGHDRLREIRRDSLHVGADHLTSMIHTLGFATLSAPAMALTDAPAGLGPDLTVALIGATGMAVATWVVTRLTSWAIAGLAATALVRIRVDQH